MINQASSSKVPCNRAKMFNPAQKKYKQVSHRPIKVKKMKEKSNVQRKSWMTPELTILTRHNAEEAVLTACKGHFGDAGPETSGVRCRSTNPTPTCMIISFT